MVGKAKSADFIYAFDLFWEHVGTHEREVRENVHRGRIPPVWYGDYWDDAFETAYTAIRPFLGKLGKFKFYAVPPALASRPTPIKAENVFHSLMIFLNPSIELEGELGVLDSAEYRAIKAAAMLEFQKRDDARIAKTRNSACTRSAKTRSELIDLRGWLLDHHFPSGKPFQVRTLTSEEIETHFGWSQPTVSRKMTKLFKGRDGMKAYAVVFGTHTTPKGYRNRLEGETLTIEALWWDKKPEDHGEDDDEGMGCLVLK